MLSLPMRSAGRHTTSRGAIERGLATAVLLGLAGAAMACAAPSVTERARSLSRMGHDDEAIATLKKDLEQHPGDVPARRLLVRLLGFTGDLPGARAQAEELSRLEGPGDPVAYLELGHAFELAHRYDDALAAYDEAATAAPTSPEGPREGGLRCARWGEAEQARPRLEEAVRRGATDAETWHALGLVRLHLGDLEGAEQAYRAGAAADPKAPECWLGVASVAITAGDAGKALEAYDQVLARRPRFAPAVLGRAWALAKLGRRQEASQALDQAEAMGAPADNIARQRAALADQGGGGPK
jgi:tetratricopeptide (TPR) repeat protein